MESLDYMVAQSFGLTGPVTWPATDEHGAGRTVTLQASTGPVYYRVFLASAGAPGTEAAPADLLAVMQSALNALGNIWVVTLTSLGLVSIQYTGTGTGAMTLPATLAAILGHSTSIGPLDTGDYVLGTYQPTHCVFSGYLADDTGWERVRPRTVASQLPTGEVYGISDHQPGGRRMVTLALHPKNQTVKAAWTLANPADPMLSTPVQAPDTRFLSSWTGEPGQAPPWSVVDWLNTTTGQSLGVAFGNLQDIVAGSGDVTFDVCYLSADCIRSGGTTAPSTPNWDARWDVSNVEFTLYAKGATR